MKKIDQENNEENSKANYLKWHYLIEAAHEEWKKYYEDEDETRGLIVENQIFDKRSGDVGCKRKRKRAEVDEPANDDPPAPAVMSEETRRRIIDSGGDAKSAVLVIKKELYTTDLSLHHNRLSLPHGQSTLSLTSAEEAKVNGGGLAVMVIQPKSGFGECEMRLKFWESSSQYVLAKDWIGFCKRNNLQKGTAIKVWSFRKNVDNVYCLALATEPNAVAKLDQPY